MALAGAGDWATAETQLGMLGQRAREGRDRARGDVLIPLVEGSRHSRAQEYRTAISGSSRSPRIVELGGSRAQRDVFHDTLLEACFRAGDASARRACWPSGSPAAPTTTGSAAAARPAA